MATAAEIQALINPHRRIIRAPVNELDKCTIFSIYPGVNNTGIDETKPTIQPGRFIIPPGSYEKPSILVVGPSSWWRELDEDQPLLEITNSSIQVADSVVKDFANGLIECNMSDAMPGLFYIQGAWKVEDLKKPDFKLRLDKANQNQKNWYSKLIRLADSLWARSNGNPLAIPALSKLAARELALDKEWTKDLQQIESVRCVGCGSLKNPSYPVCPTCKTIDVTHPNAGKIKFAV